MRPCTLVLKSRCLQCDRDPLSWGSIHIWYQCVSIAVEWAFPSELEDWLFTLFPRVNNKLVSLPWHTPDHWKISTSALCNTVVQCWGDCRYATVSIKQAIFKCGQCDIAKFPVLRTIFCLPHIFAQFNVHRTFSHNLPLSATFCRISCIKIHCITSIYRVNLTWGKLIPWHGTSWYRQIVLAKEASWYHDSKWVDTACLVVRISKPYDQCL
jgi:hypothetical protein